MVWSLDTFLQNTCLGNSKGPSRHLDIEEHNALAFNYMSTL